MDKANTMTAGNSSYGVFLSILSPTGGIHRIKRVLMMDSLDDMVLCYINERNDGREIHPMSRLKDVFSSFNAYGTEKHRYQYHGGEHGIINGFFSFTDTFVYIYNKGINKSIASVSSYNLAHFLCDFLDNESECATFSEWVQDNIFWKNRAIEAVSDLNDTNNQHLV